MRENRFMNMPTRMWLLGIFIASAITYAIRTSFIENGSIVVGYIFFYLICEVLTWLLYDALLPDFNSDENVWICEKCFESGVIVASTGDTETVLMYKAVNDHRWRNVDMLDLCSADEFDLDVYEHTLHITSFPAWAHFQLRRELLKYRQLHTSLAK